MKLSIALVREFDLEMGYVRKHLERVPEGKGAWKPAEKSMPLGWLSTFLAIVLGWAVDVLTKDEFDVAKPRTGSEPQRQEATSNQQLLELFDTNVAAGRAALVAISDEQLEQPWSLKAGGETLFAQPRWLVLRTYFLNHAIHHRAQLGVYLRLLGVAVPAVYNASADEKGGMFIDASAPI